MRDDKNNGGIVSVGEKTEGLAGGGIKMNPNVWEVWLADVKFEDGHGIKKRPVVITDDSQPYVAALEMTSRPPKSFDEFELSDWERVGLRHNSTVKTNKTLRLSNKSLIHKIGDLGLADIETILEKRSVQRSDEKKGCYIATAVYGSYDCPPVMALRIYRDYSLSKTWYGRGFIKFYYATSPTIVKCFGKTKWFNRFLKNRLDKFLGKLKAKGYNDISHYDTKKI